MGAPYSLDLRERVDAGHAVLATVSAILGLTVLLLALWR
jgi:hypothetical protein